MSIGIVFPGQGSQRVGMAQDFYEKYDCAKSVFEKASEAIGIDIMHLCFEENDEINETEYMQPAILTAEMAIYNTLKENYSIEGSYFAGHSLGEYSALAAAQAITFLDAVKIVRKRGLLMQNINIGNSGMAALIYEDIENTNYRNILAKTNAEIANINSKDQVVISGLKNHLEQAKIELEAKLHGIHIVELEVRTPFHSSLIQPIESEFSDYLDSFSENFKSENSQRVLSNCTGKLHNGKDLKNNLVKQLSSSVEWLSNMKVIWKLSSRIYEIGPKRVLGKFFSTLGAEVESIFHLRSLAKSIG